MIRLGCKNYPYVYYAKHLSPDLSNQALHNMEPPKEQLLLPFQKYEGCIHQIGGGTIRKYFPYFFIKLINLDFINTITNAFISTHESSIHL